MSVTKEEIEAMFAERDAKSEATLINTLRGFNEQLTGKVNDNINGAIGRIEKESNSRFEGIASRLGEVSQFQAEITKALEAPDLDPAATPEAVTPVFDFDKLLEEKTKQIEDSFKRTYGSKIKALEDTVDTERQEKLAITQKQIESDRDSSFLDILKKVAPKVNLYDNHEDLAFERLRRDQRFQSSEDGKSWLIKAKQKNTYTGQEEESLLSPDETNLTSLLSQDYAMYIKPRGGVGSNATTTQSYRQPSNKSAAELLESVSNNNGDFDLDAIANAIANG